MTGRVRLDDYISKISKKYRIIYESANLMTTSFLKGYFH